MHVSLVTVTYKPDWNATCLLIAANRSSLEACGLSGEILVIDNSPEAIVATSKWCNKMHYHWNEGYNVYLAGALNQAVSLAHGDAIVYFCASHGLVNDQTWISDLISPLTDPQVGLAGHVQPCEFNRVAAVPEDITEPQIHVQGGVWAARRELLNEFGFSHRFPFEYCDVDLSRRMLAGGYRLASVPTIASVAGGTIPDPENYKYIHDYRWKE